MGTMTVQAPAPPALDEEALARAVDEIGEKVTGSVHLADLIRAGSKVTTQVGGWGRGDQACALSAAGLAAKQMGLI